VQLKQQKIILVKNTDRQDMKETGFGFFYFIVTFYF